MLDSNWLQRILFFNANDRECNENIIAFADVDQSFVIIVISAIDLILKNEKCAWLWGSLKQRTVAKVLSKHRSITKWASK